jgi:hypothetical protein
MRSLRVAFAILFAIVLLTYSGALAWMQATNTQPNIMVSSSMAPEFPKNSLALTRPSADVFAVGELIGFQLSRPGTTLKIHRVAEVTPQQGYVTQGDALSARDAFIVNAAEYDLSRVVFTSLPAGYAWMLAPYMLAGLALALIALLMVRDPLWGISWAMFFLVVAWAVGSFIVGPVFNLDLVEISSGPTGGQNLVLVNVGLANMDLATSAVSNSNGVRGLNDVVLSPGEMSVTTVPSGDTKLTAQADAVLDWRPFAIMSGGYVVWMLGMMMAWRPGRKVYGIVDGMNNNEINAMREKLAVAAITAADNELMAASMRERGFNVTAPPVDKQVARVAATVEELRTLGFTVTYPEPSVEVLMVDSMLTELRGRGFQVTPLKGRAARRARKAASRNVAASA